MIEQITLKNANISDKSLHLSIQKTYSHKQGNNHSLDRSEVTGSGKKLFKQKGTGNARAGNKKTTQRRGGGKAFGPKFHLVSFKINKKVKNLALISSISLKSDNKSLYALDESKLDVNAVKDILNKNTNKKIMIILKNTNDSEVVAKFQNYKNISFHSDKNYSIHSSLKSDMLIFSNKSSLYESYIGKNI
jgi:large subunit ribosomal protein L4